MWVFEKIQKLLFKEIVEFILINILTTIIIKILNKMQKRLFSKLFFNKNINSQFALNKNILGKYCKYSFSNYQNKDNTSSLISQGTMIRKPAPEFKGTAFFNNDFVSLNSQKDFKGKWVVLFFYPLNFTFVCPTEIVEFSDKANEFRKISKNLKN